MKWLNGVVEVVGEGRRDLTGVLPPCMPEGAQGLQPWAYSSVGAQVRPPERLHPVWTLIEGEPRLVLSVRLRPGAVKRVLFWMELRWCSS